MKKYLYLIKNKKIKSYLKYWFIKETRKIVNIKESELPLELKNTLNLPIQNFKIYGNSKQNGTPSPLNPILIISIENPIDFTISNYDETKKQEIEIPVQEPFRSIGNVRDCFIKQDGVWYEKHFIGKYVATGNEQVTKSLASTTIDRFFFNLFNENTINKNVGMSSHFRYGYNTLYTFHYDLYNSTYNRVFCDFSNYGENTVQSFKTWLSENNPEFYYVLLTPTLIQCTEEQSEILENLSMLYTYNNITNITSNQNIIISFDYYEKEWG